MFLVERVVNLNAHSNAKVHVQTVALLAQVTVQADVTGHVCMLVKVLVIIDVMRTVKDSARMVVLVAVILTAVVHVERLA